MSNVILSKTSKIERVNGQQSDSVVLVNRFDYAVTRPTIQNQIKNNEKDFLLGLGVVFETIVALLGIKEPTDNEIKILRQDIVKLYGKLTLPEIKLAFELALQGQLRIGDVLMKKTYNLNMVLVSTILNAYIEYKPNLMKERNKRIEPKEEISIFPIHSDHYNSEMKASSSMVVTSIVNLYTKYLQEQDVAGEPKEGSIGDKLKKEGAGFSSGVFIRDLYCNVLEDMGLMTLDPTKVKEAETLNKLNARLKKKSFDKSGSAYKKQAVVKLFGKWEMEKITSKAVFEMLSSDVCFIDDWKVQELIGFVSKMTLQKEEGIYLVEVSKHNISKFHLVKLPIPKGIEKIAYDNYRYTVECTFNGVKYTNRTPRHFEQKYGLSLKSISLFALLKAQEHESQ